MSIDLSLFFEVRTTILKTGMRFLDLTQLGNLPSSRERFMEVLIDYLCKKWPFSLISTAWKMSEYGVILVYIFLYSDWIQENMDQEKLRIWTLFRQCYFNLNWFQGTQHCYCFKNIFFRNIINENVTVFLRFDPISWMLRWSAQ